MTNNQTQLQSLLHLKTNLSSSKMIERESKSNNNLHLSPRGNRQKKNKKRKIRSQETKVDRPKEKTTKTKIKIKIKMNIVKNVKELHNNLQIKKRYTWKSIQASKNTAPKQSTSKKFNMNLKHKMSPKNTILRK